MSLPSQTSRPTGNARSYMSRTKGLHLKPIAIGLGAIAIVAGAIWGVSKLGGKGDSPLSPQSAEARNMGTPAVPTNVAGMRQTGGSSASPTMTQAPAAPPVVTTKPADPPPLELRQGRTRSGMQTQNLGGTPSTSGMTSNPAGAPAAAPSTNPAGTSGAPANSNPSPSAPSASPGAPAAPADSLKVSDPLKGNGSAPSAPAGNGGAPAMSGSAPNDVQAMIADGFQRMGAGDPVAARAILSRALADSRLPASDQAALRTELARINDDLVFSTRVAQGDPYVEPYSVQSGDSLVKINQKNALGPDWRLIQRINKMSDAHRLSLGQHLKLIKGPFHVVVTKSAFRLDLWMGPPDKPEQWVYVRSFPVGLGESGSTPVGQYIVKKGGKLVDPPWVNPRTGEKFPGGDPKNPIGKFWVGLEGVGDSSTNTGYGIHGTIDPDSIGQQRSMGCVRMGAEDIAMVFEMMGEQVSTVKIQQ